jgi:hypothetical protein
MFRALLAYPQEALHKQNLVFSVHVMSVEHLNSGAVFCAAPLEDEQVMLETCRGP